MLTEPLPTPGIFFVPVPAPRSGSPDPCHVPETVRTTDSRVRKVIVRRRLGLDEADHNKVDTRDGRCMDGCVVYLAEAEWRGVAWFETTKWN